VFSYFTKKCGLFLYCLAYKSIQHVMLIVFEGKHVGCVVKQVSFGLCLKRFVR
jgi:hypothetical protein